MEWRITIHVVDPKVIETNNTRVGFVIEIIHSYCSGFCISSDLFYLILYFIFVAFSHSSCDHVPDVFRTTLPKV